MNLFVVGLEPTWASMSLLWKAYRPPVHQKALHGKALYTRGHLCVDKSFMVGPGTKLDWTGHNRIQRNAHWPVNNSHMSCHSLCHILCLIMLLTKRIGISSHRECFYFRFFHNRKGANLAHTSLNILIRQKWKNIQHFCIVSSYPEAIKFDNVFAKWDPMHPPPPNPNFDKKTITLT